MRVKIKLIGIGLGNPKHITAEAIDALRLCDLIIIGDKKEEKSELANLKREITLSGCVVRAGTFEHADKNNDGRLNGKEANDAVAYLFNKRRCPKKESIRG